MATLSTMSTLTKLLSGVGLVGALSIVGGPIFSPRSSKSIKDVGERLPTSDRNPELEKTKATIKSFLQRCNIPWPHPVYDHDLDRRTREDCERRGIPLSGPYSVAPYIPCSVAMAQNAYGHLRPETQMFTCVYTVFLIYTDEKFSSNIDDVRDFNERFTRGAPQSEPTLEAFAHLLHEFDEHFHRVVANIMVTSTLNLVTALLLEHETQEMPLRTGAVGYPTFSRTMSGASETYALFAFPRDLPLQTFIQVLPEMVITISNGNDILSFYKEELAGETVNRVSLLAAVHGISKSESLTRLVDDSVAAHNRCQEVLKGHKPALDAYLAFAHGYIGFHSGAKRYKLDDLAL